VWHFVEEVEHRTSASSFSVEFAVVALVGVPVLVQQWMRIQRGDAVGSPPNVFVRAFGPVYLAVLAVLWFIALPDYFGAVDGITSDGTPFGNLG